MFNRQAVSSLKGREDASRNHFLRRRPIKASGDFHQPSPAKRLLSLLKLGLIPSKKTSKSGWKLTTNKKTSSNHSSRLAATADTNNFKENPPSYAEALNQIGLASTATVSPSSSLSLQSETNVTNLPGWTMAIDSAVVNIGGQDKSPIPLLSSPPLFTLPSSSSEMATTRRTLFRRQQSLSSPAEITMSPNYLDKSQDIYNDVGAQDLTSSYLSHDISYDHYDYDLNLDYDFDLDEDLATERHRYFKGKRVHIDGVEISAEEQELTKPFNRIKLDRLPRRGNRRKQKNILIDDVENSSEEEDFIKTFNRIKFDRNRRKQNNSSSALRKENDIFDIEGNFDKLSF